MRVLIAAVLLLPPHSRAAAQVVEPTSGIHVDLSSAAVTGLECRRREFAFEQTSGLARRVKSISHGMVTEGLDPRPFVLGAFAILLTSPFFILAAPADLVSAPFRRECTFETRLEGTLSKWAGTAVGEAELMAEGKTLLSPGVEGVAAPSFFVSRSSASSDARSSFSLSIPWKVGRSKDFAILLRVKGLSAGTLVLHKQGGVFVLSEPEAEFGSGIYETQPMLIRPEKKR